MHSSLPGKFGIERPSTTFYFRTSHPVTQDAETVSGDANMKQWGAVMTADKAENATGISLADWQSVSSPLSKAAQHDRDADTRFMDMGETWLLLECCGSAPCRRTQMPLCNGSRRRLTRWQLTLIFCLCICRSKLSSSSGDNGVQCKLSWSARRS